MVESAALTWRPQLQQQQQEGGAPAPAAAPVTPAGGPTGGPTDASHGAEAPARPPVYETLGEDDQIIYDLRREHDAKALASTPDEPHAPTKPGKAGKAGKGAKVEKQDPPAPEAAPPTTAIVKYKSPEEAVSAIVAAVESGDAKKIAKALGKPEAFLEVSDAKWMAFREQQNAVRERDKQVTAREHEFNRLVAEARTEYGPAIKAAKAYRDGDMTAFVTLVQELTGERYDDAQRKVIQGELAVDPAIRKLRDELAAERAERKREREEERAAADAERKKAEQQTQYAKAVEAVAAELANHRVSKLKGFERAVLSKVRDSWDPAEREYTMSFEEAADAIMAERDEEAAALGYQRPAPALPPAPAAPPARQLPAAAPAPSVPPRGRSADARPADLEPWADPKAPDMDDDEIIESIKRDIKAGRLRT